MICKYIQATFGNFKTFFIFLGWRGGGGGGGGKMSYGYKHKTDCLSDNM